MQLVMPSNSQPSVFALADLLEQDWVVLLIVASDARRGKNVIDGGEDRPAFSP